MKALAPITATVLILPALAGAQPPEPMARVTVALVTPEEQSPLVEGVVVLAPPEVEPGVEFPQHFSQEVNPAGRVPASGRSFSTPSHV